MKRLIFILILTIFLLLPKAASANTISDSSAVLTKVVVQNDTLLDPRVAKMEKFLARYNSPLKEHSRLLVEASDNYELPWTLVAAISGVESGFCKKIPRQSFNCWGWKNGNHRFRSFEDAIFSVSRTLRFKYYDRGATTPELISSIYAPPSNTWSRKVRYFMSLIEQTKIDDYSLQLTI